MELHEHKEHDLATLSGVPQPTINRILNGVHMSPRSETVEKLANVYGLTGSHLRGDIPIDYLSNEYEIQAKDMSENKPQIRQKKSTYNLDEKKSLTEHERMSIELKIIGRVETLSDENLIFINNYIDKTEKLKKK